MDYKTRHLLKIGLVANLFEWYEFSIFGYLASLIGQLFFKPTDHPILGLLYAYEVFALSFIIRPFGGLFFGLLGDRIGRGSALRLSLIMMSIPTILIGILPTYSQAGLFAIISLCLLRFIQGFSAGGELPTTACYVLDASHPDQRSLLCSLIVASPKLGMLLASFTSFLLFYYFDQPTLLQWAWRIPFLIGIPLTGCILYIRSGIDELKPIQIPSQAIPSSVTSWKISIIPFFKGVTLVSFGAVYFYTILMWLPTYLNIFLSVPVAISHAMPTIALCFIIPLYILSGYLSQRFGYRNLILFSTYITLLFIIPLFKLLELYHEFPLTLSLVQLTLALIYVGVDSALIEILGDLFPPQNRSVSFGLAWTLSAALAGGTTPLLFSYVIHKTGWLLFPACYISIFALCALPIIIRLDKKRALNCLD
jgi:MHS family proline/betaine transporter-like MFS transporter